MNTAQIVQLVGAVPILVAFVAAQLERLSTRSSMYLSLNVVGSAILAVVAFLEAQWGFFLLECVWGIASLWSLRRGSAATGSPA
jgi:hypothetical protein